MKHQFDLLPAAFLFFLVIIGGLAMYLPQPLEQLPATFAPVEFTAVRAFHHDEVLGREVHPFGTARSTRKGDSQWGN